VSGGGKELGKRGKKGSNRAEYLEDFVSKSGVVLSGPSLGLEKLHQVMAAKKLL